jgi:hypothetical protein
LATSQSVYCPPTHGRPQTEAPRSARRATIQEPPCTHPRTATSARSTASPSTCVSGPPSPPPSTSRRRRLHHRAARHRAARAPFRDPHRHTVMMVHGSFHHLVSMPTPRLGETGRHGAASASFTTVSHEIGGVAMRFNSSKSIERESLRFSQGRLAGAGGRRLPEPAVRENEDARGRGGSCGARAARTTHHCREHRRLLGRGAEQVHWLCRKEWRFIGDSSPSSLTSTTAEARAEWR